MIGFAARAARHGRLLITKGVFELHIRFSALADGVLDVVPGAHRKCLRVGPRALRLAHLRRVDAAAISDRGEREEKTVAKTHANGLAQAAALHGLGASETVYRLRHLEEAGITRRAKPAGWAPLSCAILAHGELELIALLIERPSRADPIRLRLQIGEIGLQARNTRHQRAALGRRIGAEDQEAPVIAADLARIGKMALQLGALAARRIGRGASTVGVLAIERRPLVLQRRAIRRLGKRARAEGDQGRDEKRKARQACFELDATSPRRAGSPLGAAANALPLAAGLAGGSAVRQGISPLRIAKGISKPCTCPI